MSRRRRKKTFKLTPLGEIVVDVATVVVAAIAFAPEIAAALAPLKDEPTTASNPREERRP
jgi:hypothetical protein